MCCFVFDALGRSLFHEATERLPRHLVSDLSMSGCDKAGNAKMAPLQRI
jgi:hypothetical protein